MPIVSPSFEGNVHRLLELLQLPRQLFDVRERVHKLDTGLERGVRHVAECIDDADVPRPDDGKAAREHEEQHDGRDDHADSAKLLSRIARRVPAAIPQHGGDNELRTTQSE
jgi:hypothetical protein